jgi:uncharacterized membrane protein YbaN (DUF454 family)
MNKKIDKPNNESHFYYLKKLLGILLIIIGIIGLFLPFLQGIVFITLGLVLLGNRKLLEKLKQFAKYLKEKFIKKCS